MLPHELSAVRSNERAEPYHSDANDCLEHLMSLTRSQLGVVSVLA